MNRRQICRRRMFRSLFMLIALVTFARTAGAEQVCFPYTQGGELHVGVTEASGSEKNRIQQALDRFLSVAREGEPKAIISRYSPLDKSQQSIASHLNETPGMFSSYKGVSSARVSQSYLWGNYVVSLVAYKHERGEAALLESFLCREDGCQLSNVFQRPSSSEDLFSRWISVARKTKPQTCPNREAAVDIWPTFLLEKQHPLKVFFDAEFKDRLFPGLGQRNSVEEREDYIHDCLRMVSSIDASSTNVDVVNEAIMGLLKKCAANMDIGSLVPVLEIGEVTRRKYFTPLTFVRLIATVDNATLAYSFDDGNLQVNIFVVTMVNENNKFLIVAPILKGRMRQFDWSYFGGGAGELLTSEQFGEMLKTRHEELFK